MGLNTFMGYFRDINEMIEEVKEDFKNKTKHELTDAELRYDVDIYTFPQTWGSTALGFSGIGGQMMTQAQTTIIQVNAINEYAAVFFGGKFAYSVESINEEFRKDVSRFHMEPVYKSAKYMKQAKIENIEE